MASAGDISAANVDAMLRDRDAPDAVVVRAPDKASEAALSRIARELWRTAYDRGWAIDMSDSPRLSVRVARPSFAARLDRLVSDPLRAALSHLIRTRANAVRRRLTPRLEELRARNLSFVRECGTAAVGAPPLAAVLFREATTAEIERMPVCFASQSALLDSAQARGDRCVVGEGNGQLVCFMWVATDETFLSASIAGRVRFPAAYVHDAFTHRAHRGRGIFPAALDWLVARGQAMRVDRVYVTVAASNRASLRAVGRAGFLPVG